MFWRHLCFFVGHALGPDDVEMSASSSEIHLLHQESEQEMKWPPCRQIHLVAQAVWLLIFGALVLVVDRPRLPWPAVFLQSWKWFWGAMLNIQCPFPHHRNAPVKFKRINTNKSQNDLTESADVALWNKRTITNLIDFLFSN